MLIHSFEYTPLDGGIARLCTELATGLAGRSRSVGVLTQREEGASASAGAVVRLRRSRPGREWDAFHALRARVRSGPVVCGVWYPEGLLAMLAGVRPYVVLAHGSELMPPRARWRRKTWAWLQRRVLSNAALVVANSDYTRGLVLDSSPASRVVTVPLAVDHRRFTPGDRAEAKRALGVEGKTVVGTLSRIYAYKGHEIVLRALASLPQAARDRLVYLIAGRGPDLERLRALSRSLGVDGSVRWLGFVSEAELPGFYRACDLFALCTRELPDEREVEGFGLVFLEAQGCGTPVVGTRCGGIPDAIADGEGGWLIEQDDVKAMARHLGALLDEPDVYARAGRQARERVIRQCTWDHYLHQFCAALKSGGLDLE